jgi:hypothetical protein
MKIYSFAIAVIAALALGSLFGFKLGNDQDTPAAAPQVSVSQPAIVSQASSVEAAPAAVDPASVAPAPVEAPVGAIGVLQSINSDSLTVQTREGLQLLTFTGPASIDQLKVGDKVAVWAQSVDGRMVVRQIVVVPESPQRMHYLGLVSNVTPDQIDVVGQQGETTSFRLDATLQLMPDASRKPQVGDTVTVVAKADPLGDGWLAVAVVAR